MGLGSSSGAAATISGILALIWSQYPDWSRERVIDRLYKSAMPFRDTQIGWGVPDAYQAVGGFSRLAIAHDPAAPDVGVQYRLMARPTGDGPFSYRWSTGETSQEITRTMGDQPQVTEITVTDLTENQSLSKSTTVLPRPCARLRSKIQNLERRITNLQRTLHTATGSAKAEILEEVRALQGERDETIAGLQELGCT
jgi:hypothetical protein